MERHASWQVVDLLRTTIDFFTSRAVDEARISAELLLAHVLGVPRLNLYLQHDRPVMPDELDRFRELCRQRLNGRPVQYLAGEQFFYGLRFQVDERVLIPRPETELLVETALECLAESGEEAPSVLDIGTGSGCIPVTMALRHRGLCADAVDISPEALDVAAANIAAHEVGERVLPVRADLFDPAFAERLGKRAGSYDLVISNPPYIPDSEWEELQAEVRDYEPRLALTVPEGTECYGAIAAHASRLLRPGGLCCFELHADAAEAVRALMQEAGFGSIRVQKDYSGHDRVMVGRLGQ